MNPRFSYRVCGADLHRSTQRVEVLPNSLRLSSDFLQITYIPNEDKLVLAVEYDTIIVIFNLTIFVVLYKKLYSCIIQLFQYL